MSTITLNCLVVGENPYENAFNIEISLTKAVSELKEAIKEKKAPDFDIFTADKLKLWKVDISLEENGKLSVANTKINNIKDEIGGIRLTSLSKISTHFPSQPADEMNIHIIVQRPEKIYYTGDKASKTTTVTTLGKAKHKLSETQYVRQHLARNALKAKNFYVYLKEGAEVLHKTLEELSDDSELGDSVRRILGRDEFFENDNLKLYFQRKKRKNKEKLGTEITLSMANDRLNVANEIAHKSSLDRLRDIEEEERLSDEEDYEESEVENEPPQEKSSSNIPVEVESCSITQTKSLPCYLNGLPIHAEYLLKR